MENKIEYQPNQGEKVWVKVFSNWSSGTYIGFDIVTKKHLVREDEDGGGHLMSSDKVLPYDAWPNQPTKRQDPCNRCGKNLIEQTQRGCSEITCYRQFMNKHEKMEDEANFYEQLLEYFKNTPKEKVLEAWNKSAALDNIGPTVEEFLENNQPMLSSEEVETIAIYAYFMGRSNVLLGDFNEWVKQFKK